MLKFFTWTSESSVVNSAVGYCICLKFTILCENVTLGTEEF